jgi:hypothetical protein
LNIFDILAVENLFDNAGEVPRFTKVVAKVPNENFYFIREHLTALDRDVKI